MAEKEAQLIRLVKPTYLSLVESPANKTGFKIIRSTGGKQTMSGDRSIRVRTTQRSGGNLLSITFPQGVSEEDAQDIVTAFGLGEDYELVTNDDGSFVLRRKGSIETEEPPTAIDLGGGFIADVEVSTRADATVAGVTLVGLEFDENFQTADAVCGWLDTREIDFKEGGVEDLEGGFYVTRHDLDSKAETRKIRLDVGVTAVVARTKDTDVPHKVYRSIIEQAYGSYGWGHLSFNTALVDPAFTDASWDAIFVLRDVLENVILYSALPLDERKALVQNACTQFASYITALIDALPRDVVEATRAADRKPKQETDMPNPAAKPDDKTVQRSAPAAAPATEEQTAAPEGAAPEGTAPEGQTAPEGAAAEAQRTDGESTEGEATEGEAEGQFVTRDEMNKMIADAVTSAMAAAATQQRSDDSLNATLSKITETLTAVSDSVKVLRGEVEELGGTVVARSDDSDGSPAEGEGVHKREDGSPFVGMFGDRFK